MAAAFLGEQLAVVGEAVGVGSAGLLAGGAPPNPAVVALMAERGLDLSGHRSRQVTPALIGAADLVLGMGREHLRTVTVLDPSAWPRTFTLKEFVRRAGTVSPRAGHLADWLAEVGRGRERADLLGDDPTDDVADPAGASVAFLRKTAGEVEGLIGLLVAAVWPRQAVGRRGR